VELHIQRDTISRDRLEKIKKSVQLHLPWSWVSLVENLRYYNKKRISIEEVKRNRWNYPVLRNENLSPEELY